MGTYKPDQWNPYSEIKRKLVEDHGIPEDQIRFIQEAKTEKKRKAMIEAMNEGKIRVLFGSTEMLGTGVNAQKRCVAIHHLDAPWRPSDLQQRDGRGIRKGNEVAKLYADNKVDVIIYAVEKSLDSYKFNLLYNKQLFITQLKQNNMGCRTIDEGGMDEKGGIPFSEYVAVLSGNTDLLDKARLEKRIAGMEGERKAFQRGKGESRIKLETFLANRASNDDIIARVRKDKAAIESRMQYDKEGNRLNPLKIDGVASDDPKVIAAKLHEIEDRERTHGQPKVIGSLYGFDIVVKTDTTVKDGLDFCENRFFVRGEGNFLYNYNNGRSGGRSENRLPELHQRLRQHPPPDREIHEGQRSHREGTPRPGTGRRGSLEKGGRAEAAQSRPCRPRPQDPALPQISGCAGKEHRRSDRSRALPTGNARRTG